MFFWVASQQLYPEFMPGFHCGHFSIESVIDFASFIEQQRTQKRTAGALLLDIKDAFDSPMHVMLF